LAFFPFKAGYNAVFDMNFGTAIGSFSQGNSVIVIIHNVVIAIRFNRVDIQTQSGISCSQFVFCNKPENTILPISVLQNIDQAIMFPVFQGIGSLYNWGRMETKAYKYQNGDNHEQKHFS
jgi:hypothetical protein